MCHTYWERTTVEIFLCVASIPSCEAPHSLLVRMTLVMLNCRRGSQSNCWHCSYDPMVCWKSKAVVFSFFPFKCSWLCHVFFWKSFLIKKRHENIRLSWEKNSVCYKSWAETNTEGLGNYITEYSIFTKQFTTHTKSVDHGNACQFFSVTLLKAKHWRKLDKKN